MEKKRVVIDTGPVLQAALSPDAPAMHALRLLEKREIEVYLSYQLRSEYEDVLNRPEIRKKNPHLSPERVRALLEWLDERVKTETVVIRHVEFPADPDDEPVLNLAIEVAADYIVTRDERHLLALGRTQDWQLLYPHIRIVSTIR
jgi:putative PIN family toxin of toxin-antitoxin system